MSELEDLRRKRMAELQTQVIINNKRCKQQQMQTTTNATRDGRTKPNWKFDS